MCVVKVNRVESKNLGFSNKEQSHNSDCDTFPSSSSQAKHDIKTKTVTHSDPQHLSGSGVSTRTPETLRQWPEVSQMDQRINEAKCLSPQPQDGSTSQDCSVRVPRLEASKHSSSSSTTYSETQISLCHTYSEAHSSSSSCTETQSLMPNTDSSIDPKQISSDSTTEALYDLKPEPVEGGSSTSRGSSSPVLQACRLEKHGIEEKLFPPMLQRNTVDMPQLTPEPADKVGICPLPPVLTQEMPSLTPADDGLTDTPKLSFCTDQIAPVLQRETPTSCLPSQGAKQEVRGTGLMMSKEPLIVEHASSWHLGSSYNCKGAALSGLTGHKAPLTAHAMHKSHDIMPVSSAKTDHTQHENLPSRQGNITPGCLVYNTAPQTEQQSNVTEAANTENSEDLTQKDTLCSAGSLLTGSSNNDPLPLCAESHSQAALLPHHHTTYYPSQNTYMETKLFSSSIWKNLNSQSPAVLIQSLHPELPSDFTHDPLPYTMWTEPQCKEVTDLEDTEQDLRESENLEEESGPLTWAQLEPTSLVGVGAVEPLGLCGDYELNRGEGDGADALSVCRELERQRKAEGSLHSAVSPLRMGGEEQDGVSDMEEGGSDGKEAEQQSSAKGESSSDSSDEEENDTSNNECDESGLEPGEVCAVSVLLHTIKHVQCLALAKYTYRLFSLLMLINL